MARLPRPRPSYGVAPTPTFGGLTLPNEKGSLGIARGEQLPLRILPSHLSKVPPVGKGQQESGSTRPVLPPSQPPGKSHLTSQYSVSSPVKGAHTLQPGYEDHRKGELECLAHSRYPIMVRLLLSTLWASLGLKLLEPQSPVTSSGCHQSISPSHYCSSMSSFYR